MLAAVLQAPCPALEFGVKDIPVPAVKPGWVLVKIKAAGVNRSEVYTRQGHSPSVTLPRVLGIECVGEVADPSDSDLKPGQRVISLMGGLGRDFDGGYGEYALIPASQVYPVQSTLSWPLLGAVPETWYTAWGSLFEVLHIHAGENLLIRGASSSVGLAAIQLARHAGMTIYAATRDPRKEDSLRAAGAHQVILEGEDFCKTVGNMVPQGMDKVLDLVGTATVRQSLALARSGGVVCLTGILSGWILEQFEPLEDIPSGVYFSTFHSGSVSLEQIQALFAFIEEQHIPIPQPHCFPLREVGKAHALMESNEARGKIVLLP